MNKAMYLKLLRESSPMTHVVLLAMVIFISGTAFMLLSYLLGWTIFGVGVGEFEQAIGDLSIPRNLNLMKLFQAMQTIGLFILPPFLIAWVLHNQPARFLFLDRFPTLRNLILVIAIVVFSNPFVGWLVDVNQSMHLPQWLGALEDWMIQSEDKANAITAAFLDSQSFGGFAVNLLLVGVLPAVGEELLFRGVVQQILKRMTRNAHAAIWISAAIFSAMHMQFFGFLPRLLLGAMFGYMLEWTGTLWAPMIAHFINNAAVVVVVYFAPEMAPGMTGGEPGSMPDPNFFNAMVSLFFVGAFFRAIYVGFIRHRHEEVKSEDGV